ncbi:hypothetical protein MBVG596_1170 [Mycoplasmopsis bovigenitalium]|uniref:Mbov_0400 family ICE element protein n=1 Tax=Mycoplasmopsis bovigenitalium TaxID=2112 RepID=UPI000909909B|nr:hypothetical protein [Mycoplasmopsis bovigenitalium]BAW18610.1 hypothetical protein MBVG596_1170 [Mycoplasmopsis bovigenitalium]
MQFDKFTPYLPKHNILFNVFGQPIDRHPVVIWYNDNEDMYYFAKARSASKKGIIRDKLPTEILIPASATNSDSLFFKDSLLDCSQIFRMRGKDFEVAYGNNKTLSVDELPFNYATQIINEIEKNLKNDHISLMNVSITGYDDKQEPIIEPELLYASGGSFEQEKGWYHNLTNNETIGKVNKFVDDYFKKTHQAAELNSIKDGIYIVNEELRYRINYPIYHYIYDNELLDKGYNVVEIIDLVKRDIFNTEEFKDYKVSDADVWGSLTLRWGKRRTSLNSVDEYRINSDKLTKIQQDHFFNNVKDNELLEFKKAYENESLGEWIDNSCFINEFEDYIKQEFEDYYLPIEKMASWYIQKRFRIENNSIIDEELENRNLLNQNSHELKQQVQKHRKMRM